MCLSDQWTFLFVNWMGISLNGICKAYDEERNSVRLFRRMRGLDPQMSGFTEGCEAGIYHFSVATCDTE